jgi:hypothetical protein
MNEMKMTFTVHLSKYNGDPEIRKMIKHIAQGRVVLTPADD